MKAASAGEIKKNGAGKDREFFVIHLDSYYGLYFLDGGEVNVPSIWGRDNPCGDFVPRDITLRRRGLFRDEEVLRVSRTLYAYEDDAVFYEFFSGKVIGKRKKCSGYNCDRIIRNGYVLTSFGELEDGTYTVYKLSAQSFAERVKPYIPYRQHMATEMSRLLDSLDRKYRELCDYMDKNKRNERRSRSWLDSMIDGN